MNKEIEQEIKDKMTDTLTRCVLEVMKLCEEYNLDRDCMMQQAVDMLNNMVAHNSFRYFKT